MKFAGNKELDNMMQPRAIKTSINCSERLFAGGFWKEIVKGTWKMMLMLLTCIVEMGGGELFSRLRPQFW